MTSRRLKIAFGAEWLHLERQIPDGEPKYIPECRCVRCRSQAEPSQEYPSRVPGEVLGKEPTAGRAGSGGNLLGLTAALALQNPLYSNLQQHSNHSKGKKRDRRAWRIPNKALCWWILWINAQQQQLAEVLLVIMNYNYFVGNYNSFVSSQRNGSNPSQAGHWKQWQSFIFFFSRWLKCSG